MKTTYTVYHVNPSLTHKAEVDWPEDPGYGRIKALVELIVEGPIEHVTVLDPAKADAATVDPRADRRDMFVDEMGHVRAGGPRPRNEAATKIYRANWLRNHPGQDPEDLPFIAGTAVLFDRIVWS